MPGAGCGCRAGRCGALAGGHVDAFAALGGPDRDASAGAFEVERRTGRWWTFGGLALGSVEIVLGAIVLYAGQGNLRLVTAAVGAWGLIGGTLLLLEGFKIRRSLRPH
jgi:hypothetical protein